MGADKKKSFVFNLEWMDVLEDYPKEVRIEVLDAIIRYAQSGTLIEMKPLAKMAFSFIKKEMDYNEKKYEETRIRRIEAGRKGGLSKQSQAELSNPSKTKQSQAELSNPSKTKQSQAELSNPSKTKQSQAELSNPSYNVYDNVNVNDNEYVYDDKENIEKKAELSLNTHSTDELSEKHSEENVVDETPPPLTDEETAKAEKKKKFKYGEFVALTRDEYAKLCENHTEEAAKRMIEILDNYKGSKGVKYKSDYRTILNWVVDRYYEEEQKHGNERNTINNGGCASDNKGCATESVSLESGNGSGGSVKPPKDYSERF